MSQQYPIINDFSAGELSERMEGRIDIPGYYKGCKTMDNCIMVAQGGAEKRPGTEYIGETMNYNSYGQEVKLVPFEVNDQQIYVLEMGHFYTRVWDAITRTVVADLGGGRTHLDTPYTSSEVLEVQFATTEGKIFFAHQNYPFQYIECTNTTAGVPEFNLVLQYMGAEEYTAIAYPKGANVKYVGEYYEALVKTLSSDTPSIGEWIGYGSISGSSYPSGTITQYTTGNFAIGDIKLFRGGLYRAKRAYTLGGTCDPVNEVTEPVTVEGDIQDTHVTYASLCTNRTWIGRCTSRESVEVYLGRKYNDDTHVVTVINKEKKLIRWYVEYRIDYIYPQSTKGTADGYWTYVVDVPGGDRTEEISSYTAGTYALEDVVYDPATYVLYRSQSDGNTGTPGVDAKWKLVGNNPFFAVEGDYPAAVAFMNQRLFIAGTKSHPQTIWASKVGYNSNFNIGFDDDDSFSFEIAAERSSRIKWVIAKDNLMIGTTSGEWMATGAADANITPTNIRVLRQSSYGSAYSQAIFVADALLFFQKGGLKLREFMYSNDNRAYLANDLTFFADHITNPGISCSTYQQNPDSILWCVRTDGDLIGLTYDRLNQIAGWHHHSTNGRFESLCAVDGVGEEDELWLVVNRTFESGYKRSIEIMAPRVRATTKKYVFTDSSIIFSAGGVYKITSITDQGTYCEVTYVGASGLVDDEKIKIKQTDNPLFDHKDFTVSGLVQGASTGTFNISFGGELYYPGAFDAIEIGTVSVVTNIITGLDHLLGSYVNCVADGGAYIDKLVIADVDGAGGVGVDLGVTHNAVTCGLKYTMLIEPQSIELPGTLTMKRRISSVVLKLFKSLGGTVGGIDDTMERLLYRTTSIPFGEAPAPFTGTIIVPIDIDSEREASIRIMNEDPYPMTVLAIVSEIKYSR